MYNVLYVNYTSKKLLKMKERDGVICADMEKSFKILLIEKLHSNVYDGSL